MKARASTFGRCRTESVTSRVRSSRSNSGCFASLAATATITRSKSFAARSVTSRCPLVNGSKLPG